MALDTAAKRYSAIHVMCPWRALSVVPSGTIDQPARQAAAWVYSGILAEAPVVVTGGPVWVWVNGAATPPGTTTQGTQVVWMCVNGAWVKPSPLIPPWPRRAHREDRR